MSDLGNLSITAYNQKRKQNTLSENLAVARFVPNKSVASTLPVSFWVPIMRYGVFLNPEEEI